MGAAALAQEGYHTQEVVSLASLRVVTEDFKPNLIPLEETVISEERYAHSLRTIRKVGEIAMHGEIEEGDAFPEVMLRADFDTAIGEMLKTDSEFRHLLDINPRASYRVWNGEVLMANGKPVVTMIEDGHRASLEAAKTNPLMQGQAERDGEDVRNAHRVNTLQPGQMLVVPSADPAEGYARDGVQFWDSLGYREGMIFFQWYYRPDEYTVHAGSCSVEGGDRDSLRQLLASYGTEVPEKISDAEWLRHGIELEMGYVTEDEAEERAKSIRKEFYQLMGLEEERFSVTDFIAANRHIMDEIFYGVYLPMAKASFKGRKNAEMHDLAGALLAQSNHLQSKIRSDVMRVYNMNSFDDEATRIMEFLIRYGAVERLRAVLAQGLAGNTDPQNFWSQPMPDQWRHMSGTESSVTSLLANNVAAGAKAGRNYGGCAAGKNMSKADKGDSDGGPQDAFGGKDDDSGEPSGKKWMRCPSCKGKVFDDPCAKNLKCWHCPAKVVNGRVVTGDSSGSKADKENKAEQTKKDNMEKIEVIPQPETPTLVRQQATGSLALVGAASSS